MRKKDSLKILSTLLETVQTTNCQEESPKREEPMENSLADDFFDDLVLPFPVKEIHESEEIIKCDKLDYFNYFDKIDNDITRIDTERKQAKIESNHIKYFKLTIKKLYLKWERSNMKDRRALDIGDWYKEAKSLYEKKEYAESFPIMRKVAALRHHEAQLYLAYMYKNGLGTDRNSEEAFKWFYRVAKYELKQNCMPNKEERTALREAAYLFRQNKVPAKFIKDGRRIDNAYRCIIEAEKYQNLSHGHAGQY